MVLKLMTSENEKSHGSMMLRIGAIAFGLGTLIYTGLGKNNTISGNSVYIILKNSINIFIAENRIMNLAKLLPRTPPEKNYTWFFFGRKCK